MLAALMKDGCATKEHVSEYSDVPCTPEIRMYFLFVSLCGEGVFKRITGIKCCDMIF